MAFAFLRLKELSLLLMAIPLDKLNWKPNLLESLPKVFTQQQEPNGTYKVKLMVGTCTMGCCDGPAAKVQLSAHRTVL